jgi:hypothetical protein
MILLNQILATVSFLAFLFALFYLLYTRRLPVTYITDYTRGVRFAKGAFSGVLGPGAYQFSSRNIHVDIVDMRPVPFLDRITYRDALQNDSVMSIGAELLVDDPYVAATSLKNRVNDSLPMVREMLGTVARRQIADTSGDSRVRMAADMTAAVNSDLKRVGMKVQNLEITELATRAAATQPQVSTNLN